MQIGTGRMQISDITAALQTGVFSENCSIICAPPQGLVLECVLYPPEHNLFATDIGDSVAVSDRTHDDMSTAVPLI